MSEMLERAAAFGAENSACGAADPKLRSYCRGCPAVTFGYTGNMYSADPQCWKEVVL